MGECKRWLVACSREFFAEKNITRSTDICALHWPGESSFIDEECVDEKCAVIDTYICVNPSGKLVSDQGFCWCPTRKHPRTFVVSCLR